MNCRLGVATLCGFIFVYITLLVGVQTSGGGADDQSRLLSTLLTNYSSHVMPRLDMSSPVDVHISMSIMAVVNLDTRTQVLSLQGYAKVCWSDLLIRWDPGDYGNISYVILQQNAIWKPDIIMENSLRENIYVGSEDTRVHVDNDGWVTWVPVFISDFKCQVDVTSYPMDSNICSIVINSWMYDISYVKLHVADPHTTLEESVFNGQFDIQVIEPFTVIENYGVYDYDNIHFRIQLLRRPYYTFLSTEKISLSLNVLLATTVLIGVVHDDLPDRSDAISSVAIYVLILLLLAFLGVLGNTLVLLLHQHDQANQPPIISDHRDIDHADITYNEDTTSIKDYNTEKTPGHHFIHANVSLKPSKENENVFFVETPHMRLNRRPEVPDAPAQETASRAARLNRALLIASVICLCGCTVMAFVLMVY